MTLTVSCRLAFHSLTPSHLSLSLKRRFKHVNEKWVNNSSPMVVDFEVYFFVLEKRYLRGSPILIWPRSDDGIHNKIAEIFQFLSTHTRANLYWNVMMINGTPQWFSQRMTDRNVELYFILYCSQSANFNHFLIHWFNAFSYEMHARAIILHIEWIIISSST